MLITGVLNPTDRNKFIIHAEVTPELKPKLFREKHLKSRLDDKVDDRHGVIEKISDEQHIFPKYNH